MMGTPMGYGGMGYGSGYNRQMGGSRQEEVIIRRGLYILKCLI